MLNSFKAPYKIERKRRETERDRKRETCTSDPSFFYIANLMTKQLAP